MISCEVCVENHPQPGVRCENCGGCLNTCVRARDCDFNGSLPVVVDVNTHTAPARASIVPKSVKIEDAVRCFMLSSVASRFSSIEISNEDIMILSKEFIEIMDEKLSLVDQTFQYFIIDSKSKKFEELDRNNLFTNQGMDYVMYKDYKRVNLGKKIAIMEEGEDDKV